MRAGGSEGAVIPRVEMDLISPHTLDALCMGTRRAFDELLELLRWIDGPQAELSLANYVLATTNDPWVLAATSADVTPCFGRTPIEAMGLLASLALTASFRGALLDGIWRQRLVDVGLPMKSREEIATLLRFGA